LNKQAKRVNAAFLWCTGPSSPRGAPMNSKVSEGEGCQWHVKWSGWTPPSPATTHLEGLQQGQALRPVWI